MKRREHRHMRLASMNPYLHVVRSASVAADAASAAAAEGAAVAVDPTASVAQVGPLSCGLPNVGVQQH